MGASPVVKQGEAFVKRHRVAAGRQKSGRAEAYDPPSEYANVHFDQLITREFVAALEKTASLRVNSMSFGGLVAQSVEQRTFNL